MRQPRSQRVLWALTAVLVLALPLLAVLQVRWARQLERADIEQLRVRTTEQLDAAREVLEVELLSWTHVFQGNIDTGPPLVNPRVGWRLSSPLRDAVRDVFLVRQAPSIEERQWYSLPEQGDPVPLDAPAVDLEGGALGPLSISLLPRPFDDKHLVLRTLLLEGALVPVIEEAMTTFDVGHSPTLVVLLDRVAIASWVEEVIARHLGREREVLDYGVAATGAGFEDEWILGTPPAVAGEREEIMHHVEVELASLDALGRSLAAVIPPCMNVGTCEEGDDHDRRIDEMEGGTPPRLFLNIPDSREVWRLNVRNQRDALDPRLRALWARNLAIGLAALAVLGIAVGVLVALTAQYQRLAQAQFDFVTGVTHELRTPLSVLGVASANLADGLVSDDDRVRQYGQVLRKEVTRLSDLVERVLGFTRAQSDPTENACATVEDSIDRVVHRLAPETAERGVSLEVEVAEGLPEIAVHSWLLDSLLQNLLSNALKYGGDRVRIEAKSTRKRRRTVVTLTVRDWGPGLGRFERRRIFEPFFRGRKARDDQQPGAGLGLSWVARLVQRAGGRLVVHSKPGDGSRFGVELPVAGSHV